MGGKSRTTGHSVVMEAKNTSTRPKEVYNDSKVERDASELGFRKDEGKLGGQREEPKVWKQPGECPTKRRGQR